MTDEVKVGILFLVVAALAVGTGIYLTEAGARWGTYDLVVHFADTKGLQPGANVMLAGVNIGKVRSIELRPDPRFPNEPVRVTLSLQKDVPLYATDRFVIDQGALIGDKFLTVQRPSAQELAATQRTRGARLEPGDEVVGGPALGFATLSEQLQQLIAQASHSLERLAATYASPEIKKNVAHFMAQVDSASRHLTAITESTLRLIASLNQVVERNQGAVSESLHNIAAATREVRITARNINQMIEGIAAGPIPTQLLVTVTNMRKVSEDLRASAEAVHGFLAGPENQQRLENTLANVAATTADLRTVAGNLRRVTDDPQVEAEIRSTLANLKATTDNLREVSEATRQLMTNQENLEAIRDSLANLRELTTQGVAVTQKASAALDRVDRTMDRLGEVAANFQPQVQTARLSMEATRGESTRTDLNADLRWSGDPDALWRVGVRGIGSSETLNLQRGWQWGPRATIRAGIFGSKPGAAVTYRVAPYSVWELEAWHPGENRLDLRTYWGLTDGWELTAGVVRLFSDNDPFVGLQRVIYARRGPASTETK